MKNIKRMLAVALPLLFATCMYGQKNYKLTGKIISATNTPIADAVVSVQDTLNATTKADGEFTFKLRDKSGVISVWAPGYLPVRQLLNGRTEVVIMMISDNQYKHNEQVVLPFRGDNTEVSDYTAATNIAKKDFLLGSAKIDRALAGQVAGLQVKRGSGMPGEGSYYNLRGIRSLTGDNAPLIVVNGVPYLPDKNESPIIGGLTRDIFQAYNINDIQNITVLKGAEAAMYGSMGSNGVILIQTDGASSNDMETKVSYYGQYGVTWSDKRIPLLGGKDYLNYLTDAGMTYYSDMDKFYSNFPFLKDPNNPLYLNTYNNQTDWQDLMYNTGYATDHLFRVEGGDEIAKYDLSLGYSKENGLYESTSTERFHTQLNGNILVSKKVDIFATIGLAYLNGHFQEQGMNIKTNPILAAYAQSPVLSPYNKDKDGNILSTYSPYYFGKCTTMDFAISNPLAIVNTLDAHNRQYDLTLRAGVNYTPLPGLVFTGLVGMYYNYDNESMFIPGLTDKTIVPISDTYGTANNMVRSGVGETSNMYLNLNARYSKMFNRIHQLNAIAGAQILTTKNEFDVGEGRNTDNDFYQTLGNTQADGRRFYGYLNKWNWMSYYGHADYTYNNLVQASVNVSVDGASSTGTSANRFYVYPSAGVTLLGKGWKPLQNSEWINKLNVRAEYSLTGNTRFASNMGTFYYSSAAYQDISAIARVNVPNTHLKPEKNASLNLGLDLSLFRNRLNVSFDYFNNKISDMICMQPTSSIYGSAPYYANVGKMDNKGVELSVQASLVRTRDFEWIVGGNIAHYDDKITSLGGEERIINGNWITEVGKSPYQFYGYQVVGVFSTQAEAEAANLMADNGNYFRGGDMHYVDQNGDHRIDSKDRVALGSAAPDFFGGFYTQFKYKGFALGAEFSYSKGNMAYNAVRNQLEGMNTLGNQSIAVLNRWSLDGQVTDMPRVQHNDPYRSTSFSERWLEDASYLRMKSVTLSYSFDKTVLNFFRSGTLYVSGENLLTATKYLGLDPEFSYSYSETSQGLDYAKMVQPKSVKFGVNLKF